MSELSALVRAAPLPPPAPSPPVPCSVTARTIVVDWEAGATENGVTQHIYEVIVSEACAASPETSTWSLRAASAPLQFKNMQPLTAYAFSLRVWGTGGWSEWSLQSAPCETTNVWTKEEIVESLIPYFGASLGDIFRCFDTNCDGFLTKEDFAAGLAEASLDMVPHEEKLRLFGEADVSQRGYISLREFTKCFMPVGNEPLGWKVVRRTSSSPAFKTPRGSSVGACTPDRRVTPRAAHSSQSRQTGRAEQRRASPTRSTQSVNSTPSLANPKLSNSNSAPRRVSSTPRSSPSSLVSPGGVASGRIATSTTLGQFTPPVPRRLDKDVDSSPLTSSAGPRKLSPVPRLIGLGVLNSQNRKTPRSMLPK